MGTVPANFHGKKGRSGRRPMKIEAGQFREKVRKEITAEVFEKLKHQVIFKAWEKKQKKMSENEAVAIVLKDMGVRGEQTLQGLVVNIQNYAESDRIHRAIQLDTRAAPLESSSITCQIQNDSVASQSTEDDTSNKRAFSLGSG